MNEEQLKAWQLKPHTIQARLVKALIASGRASPCDLNAGEKVAQALVSPLRRKLAPFAIAIFCLRDGSHAYTMSHATRALLSEGGLRGADDDAVRELAQYNARFKPLPGKSIHQLTKAALDARIARAAEGDLAAIGPDALDAVLAEVRASVPGASRDSVRCYLSDNGLPRVRAEFGLMRDGAMRPAPARSPKPWRPGDPKPVFLEGRVG